jgi:hypothetical protein
MLLRTQICTASAPRRFPNGDLRMRDRCCGASVYPLLQVFADLVMFLPVGDGRNGKEGQRENVEDEGLDQTDEDLQA